MSKKTKKVKYLFLKCYRPEHYEVEPDFAIIRLTKDLTEWLSRESQRGIDLKKQVPDFSSIKVNTCLHVPMFLDYSEAEGLLGTRKLGVAEEDFDTRGFHIVELSPKTDSAEEMYRMDYPKLQVYPDGDVQWIASNHYSDCESDTSMLSVKSLREIKKACAS